MPATRKPKDATDSSAKSGFISQATVNMLARIENLKAAIVALEFAESMLRDSGQFGRVNEDDYRDHWLILRGKLFEALYQVEGQVALWGVLTDDKKLRQMALKAATRFVAHQNASIMEYLTLDGVHPGRYLAGTHDRFRKELNKAIERETGEPVKDAEKVEGATDEERQGEEGRAARGGQPQP